MAPVKMSEAQTAALTRIAKGTVQKIQGIRAPDYFRDREDWTNLHPSTVHSLVSRKLVMYADHPTLWYAKKLRLTDAGRALLDAA